VAEPGSKTKLSKRKLAKYLKNREFAQLLEHGQKIADRMGMNTDPDTFNPVIVDFYEQVGYLPEALLNYLALLGWSLDERTEHFSREELVEHFTLERVNSAPASFDPAKLAAFEQRHFNLLPIERKAALAMPFLQRAGLVPSPAGGDVEQFVERVAAAAGDRLRVAGDMLDFDEFFVADDQLAYDPKAVEKRLRAEGAAELLGQFRDRLAELTAFDSETLDREMHAFIEARGIKVGEVIHALRVATTGKQVGLGMFDALALLGRDRTLARIERALRL
jgi:glutamyl-tRNA synthetase